ncbi:amyloid beta A4 precursor protein-binding family B member 1-interacting protein-like [Aulostomus maculatus]
MEVVTVNVTSEFDHRHSMMLGTEEMEDIDAVFSHLLGEIDHLSQTLGPAADPQEVQPATSPPETPFSIGFRDLDESLNELEEQDLDALVADLRSESTAISEVTPQKQSSPTNHQPAQTHLPGSSGGPPMSEPQTKTDKIKLALEKLKEANVRKLIVKVLMADGGFKTLMVDRRQTVRDVLDKLFEKTHCDCSISWSLCEMNPELHTERSFEDHELLVEPLAEWTCHSENKIYFVSRPQKYMMFTEPQLLFLWTKKTPSPGEISQEAKELLLQEHFCGSTLIVPDLEGTLYLKEDGRKFWKPRYFVLRASGLYYVPKGKTKTSSNLACFLRFDKVNIYTTSDYKQRYRAPSNFCFVLKHPCIQKESQYIKFLCCDSQDTLLLWINALRVAKYGTVLYKNYQAAVKRASTLQVVRSAVSKDLSHQRAPQTPPQPAGPAPPETTIVPDYPYEPLPDFIPPPPAGYKQA